MVVVSVSVSKMHVCASLVVCMIMWCLFVYVYCCVSK
jgi:hypothetical protein